MKNAMSQEENKLSDERLADLADFIDRTGAEEVMIDASAVAELRSRRASAGGEAGVPADARLRMYYPIVMPLNSDGIGPASEKLGEIRKLTWEVWDQFCDTFGSFDCLADAIMEAERLNREHYSALHPKAVPDVSEEQVEAAAIALFRYDYPQDRWERFGQKDYHPEKYRAKARAALSAAQGVE